MASTSAVGRSSASKEFPNWLLMPDELMENILGRLSSVEKLRIAAKVCRTWRRICKVPAMWKVIDINKWQDGCDTNYKIEMLTKQAVDLSCGELIDISIGGFCTDDLLDYIVLRSSKVKRLDIWSCDHMTFGPAIKRLKHLEELEFSHIFISAEDIEIIGQNCPQLKSFKIFDTIYTGLYVECDDQAVAIANNMPGLRHLQIYGHEMTNDGLKAILNGCPHLQSLDVRECHNLYLGGKLGKLCMKRIKDFKHNSTQSSDDDSDDMYMYSSGSDVDESSEGDN